MPRRGERKCARCPCRSLGFTADSPCRWGPLRAVRDSRQAPKAESASLFVVHALIDAKLPAVTAGLAQYSPHSAISCRRLSKRSPRWYAASTLLATTCASAASTTSRGKPVRSAAHVRKLDRKPCTVTSPRPMRRNVINSAMLLKGLPR